MITELKKGLGLCKACKSNWEKKRKMCVKIESQPITNTHTAKSTKAHNTRKYK
jgi:hypothetical protein